MKLKLTRFGISMGALGLGLSLLLIARMDYVVSFQESESSASAPWLFDFGRWWGYVSSSRGLTLHLGALVALGTAVAAMAWPRRNGAD